MSFVRSVQGAVALVSLIATAGAQAGEGTGTVDTLVVRDTDGLTYVQLSTPPTNRPSCAAGTTYWMIPSENSEAGKKLYALLLAAHVSGKTVIIAGKNTCARWGDGEDIQYVLMQQ